MAVNHPCPQVPKDKGGLHCLALQLFSCVILGSIISSVIGQSITACGQSVDNK